MTGRNPIEALAHLRHEFGEHGGYVNMSIEASSTFTVMEPGTMPRDVPGSQRPRCRLLSLRPPLQSHRLQPGSAARGALEGTEAAYCTASGMGAIASTLFALCEAGDHIVASNAVYGGTYALMHDFLPAKAGSGDDVC